MHDQTQNTESALRLEIAKLKAALDEAVRITREQESRRIVDEALYREQSWAAEIERRRLDVESARAEVRLAERLAIANHDNAEKSLLVERLKKELEQGKSELAEARAAFNIVMNSYSMTITKPIRALAKALRRVRR